MADKNKKAERRALLVPAPELGDGRTVAVVALSGRELAAMHEALDARRDRESGALPPGIFAAAVAVATAVDPESGAFVHDPKDLDLVADMPASYTERLFLAADELNLLSAARRRAARENFTVAPISVAGTGSR
jgi:Ser/Thr protein kinase RdoA (MazF antagonist)